MNDDYVIPKFYYIYGEPGCGKSLIAFLLGKKYITGCYYQKGSQTNGFQWLNYKNEKVLVLENEVYKNKYFEIELLMRVTIYNRIKNVNLHPEVLLIMSRSAPDSEMRRILTVYKGNAFQVSNKKPNETIYSILDRISTFSLVTDTAKEYKKELEKKEEENKLLEELKAEEDKKKKLILETKTKSMRLTPQEEKKPNIKVIEKIEKPVERKLEDSIHGMRLIIKCTYGNYSKISEMLKAMINLKFFISVLNEYEEVYIFVVFRRSVDLISKYGEKYTKAGSTYWDGISNIWKRGVLLESYNFMGYGEMKVTNVPASEILALSPTEASETLSLNDYDIYIRLKNTNK